MDKSKSLDPKMKIAFFGASSLGYSCCEAILEAGYEVSIIFTIPKEFKISYSPNKPVSNVLYKDFSVLGTKYNIPVYEINQNIREYIDTFKSYQPDFILAIGWYYMIPQKFIDIVPKGAAGIHASMLPKGRGNAPLVWALINGESETGITFFFFSEGVDNGEIIGQKKILINDNETIATLLEKVEKKSISLLLESMPRISDGSVKTIKQDENYATYYRKRAPEDGIIDWSKNSEQIDRFIRAQTRPYPGAYTIIQNKKIIIWDATIIDLDQEEI